jgi:hypothetical protein
MSGNNLPPPNPPPNALLQLLGTAATSAGNLAGVISSTTQADADRSWIARKIITIFVWVVFGVLGLLTLQGIMTGQWALVASQAAELIKTAVLPIVTLVLGYYFGQAGKG